MGSSRSFLIDQYSKITYNVGIVTKEGGNKMKLVFCMLLLSVLFGCGTVGGTVSGMGQDLSRAGEWIKSR
jgi:hypothetical protein